MEGSGSSCGEGVPLCVTLCFLSTGSSMAARDLGSNSVKKI